MLQLYLISPSLRMNCTNLDESSEDKALMAPHVLAMSATPIPRTLALALYGDMSLTQVCETIPLSLILYYFFSCMMLYI